MPTYVKRCRGCGCPLHISAPDYCSRRCAERHSFSVTCDCPSCERTWTRDEA